MRNRLHGGMFHGLIDGGRTTIEGPSENVRKTQDIVDLIGEIRTTCADHGVRAGGIGLLRHDLGIGIGQRHDQGLGGHLGQHVLFQNTTCGEAEKNISALNDFSQGALVGLLRENFLILVHEFVAALIDHALNVVIQIFSRFAPMDTSRLRQAKAAAPAPDVVIFTSSRRFPASSSALTTAAATMIAVPCWSS